MCEKLIAGLSSKMSDTLESMISSPGEEGTTLNLFWVSLCLCMATAFFTEFASNTATANIVVPILIDLSKRLCINPIYLGKHTVHKSSRVTLTLFWSVVFLDSQLVPPLFNLTRCDILSVHVSSFHL